MAAEGEVFGEMASPSEWIPHVHAFVDLSLSQDHHDACLGKIVSFIKTDMLTLEILVKEMEMYLTTSDAVTRARGILLLAQVLVSLVSKPIDVAAVHSLIDFFTSRLADWQAIHGALIGCVALLRRYSAVGMVSTCDARNLAQSFLVNLQVQALAQADRKLCFELLECLLSAHPDALRPLGDDLVYGVCEAIDEEKDPWCLLHCFRIVELLVDLFPDPSGPLASFSKDIFEILGRYFPIYFTHAKDDTLDVKREDLSRALMNALSSTPLFEPFCIPLLLEKLTSSLQIAKIDALKYLSHCVIQYGSDRMSNHAKAIWLSLKDIIFTFSSSQEPVTSSTLELLENQSKENEVMKEALMCWANCVLVCDGSNEVFLPLMMQDSDVVMIFSSITGDYCWAHMSTECKKRLNALGSLVYVAAKVSSTCCTKVIESFFPRLMDLLGISSRDVPLDSVPEVNNSLSIKLNSGALFLCIELLTACRNLAVDLVSRDVSSQCVPSQHGWFHLLQNFAEPLVLGLRFALSSAESTIIKNQAIEGTDGICVVRCLQILATFPGCFSPLPEAVFGDILRSFILVIADSCREKALWKHSLKNLVQIGSSIEKFGDPKRCISYKNIVVERSLSWPMHESSVPLSVKLEVLFDIGTTRVDFAVRILEGLKEILSSNLIEALVKGNHVCAKIATSVLNCLSIRLLPWISTCGMAQLVSANLRTYTNSVVQIRELPCSELWSFMTLLSACSPLSSMTCVDESLILPENLCKQNSCKSFREPSLISWFFDQDAGKESKDEAFLLLSESLWLYLSTILEINLGLQEHGLFDALMLMMRLAVSYCTEEHQTLIVMKGYQILMAKTSFLHRDSCFFSASASEDIIRRTTASYFSLFDKWLVSLLASVVIALRPRVILPDVWMLLKIFTVAVITGLEAAAQALGSMVNKWPTALDTDIVGACTLEDALDFILKIVCDSSRWNNQSVKCVSLANIQKNITHINIDGGCFVDTHAVVGIAWITKGLVMRGHEKVKNMATFLLECLLSSGRVKHLTVQIDNGSFKDKSVESFEDKSFEASISAADAFQLISSDSEVSLNKIFHASIRPLYKQRFYASMMPLISHNIAESDFSVTRSLLYRALGHIICNAPLVAVLSESKKIVPLLLDGLSTLSEEQLNKNLIYSLLLVLSGILVDEIGKEAVLDNMASIINNLVQLVSFPHMMVVRETAIQCLIAISGLPQVQIFPYGRQVLKAIRRALDDQKRSVRQEAVRCHHAWASITSKVV
ncbi:MMS19 nucleotide excision repair protein homolog [Nymphaea colorata]|nr:MMS19 nucleotide excision repair protein homolog [Nymphaea colorata]